jgi:hypothetical protein
VDPTVATDPEFASRFIAGQLIFWVGACIVMGIIGWFVFREQLNERKTLRRLMDRISPRFPDFEPASITRWVHTAAPHLWKGWAVGHVRTLDGHVTDGFAEEQRAYLAGGPVSNATLEAVIKVHPLGLAMVGPGPAPADVEIVLRVEQRVLDEGAKSARDVQQFWSLRHDGHRWRLHHVEEALRDLTDLHRRPPPPPVKEWRRPDAPAGKESG